MSGGAQSWDIGAAVNNEIASLPTVTQNSQTWSQGTVTIPAGSYRQIATIVLNSPYVNLRCEPGTILVYMGSGDAIRILSSVQISGPARRSQNQGPSVQNCSIYNASSTAISGIRAGDISNIHLTNADQSAYHYGVCPIHWIDTADCSQRIPGGLCLLLVHLLNPAYSSTRSNARPPEHLMC